MNISTVEGSKVIDLERLQQLSYERSKLWATFLDNIHESENQCEIPLENIEEYIGDDPAEEDDDALASMEDEAYDDNVDPEALRDITNSTRLSLMVGGNNKSTLLADSSCNGGVKNDLIGMLNETLPVINEHNRHMRETGFDRILNTFDAKKIEEKVGGWLKRHNSLCGAGANEGDNTINNNNNDKRKDLHCHVKNKRAVEQQQRLPVPYMPFNSYHQPDDESDSDTSFNSGETARYIKSSRSANIKNSASTTMMIKTYRMVKSTRQALREKYGYEPEGFADSHLNELRLRRRLAKESAALHHHFNDIHLSSRSHKKSLYHHYVTPTTTHTNIHSRRKVLRKRTTSNSFSSTMEDTSSDSDNYYDERARSSRRKYRTCCSERHYAKYMSGHALVVNPTPMTATVKRASHRAHKTPSCGRNDRMLYYYTGHTHSSMQSPPSPNNFPKSFVKKSLKRLDNRPCRKESECRCCDQKRLCKEYRHLADTSTEEWIVENSFSPEKDSPVMTSTQLPSSKMSDRSNIVHENETKKPPSKESECQTKASNYQGKETHQKSAKKVEESASNIDEKDEEGIRNGSGMKLELQISLKESSNEINEKEDEASLFKHPENIDKNINKPKSESKKKASKPPTEKKTKKNTKTKKELTISPNDSFQIELQIALKESEDLYRKEQMKNANKQEQKADEEERKDDTKTLCGSMLLNNQKSLLAEETYSDFKVVYNSTTVDKNYTKEFPKSKLNSYSKSSKSNKTKKEEDISEVPLQKVDSKRRVRKLENIKKDKTKQLGIHLEPLQDPDRLQSSVKYETKGTNKSQVDVLTTLRQGESDTEGNESIQTKNSEHKKSKNTDSSAMSSKGTSNNTISNKSQLNILNCLQKEEEFSRPEGNENIHTTNSEHKVANDIGSSKKSTKKISNNKTSKQGKADFAQESNVAPSKSLKSHEINEVVSNTSKINETKKQSKLDESTNQINNKMDTTKASKLDESNSRALSLNKTSTNKITNKMDTMADKVDQEISSKNKQLKRKKERPKPKSKLTQTPMIILSDDEIPVKIQQKNKPTNQKVNKEDLSNNNNSSNNANVTSTTMYHQSPSLEIKSKTHIKRTALRILSSDRDDDDDIDCTVVSSTTANFEPPAIDIERKENDEPTTSSSSSSSNVTFMNNKNQKIIPSNYDPNKGILIYAPQNSSLAPPQSFSQDGASFVITHEHLSRVIGQKAATKFLKYYIGRRRFNSKSTIYFKPPASGVVQDTSEESSSDDDDLEYIGQYGDLYESFGGGPGNDSAGHKHS
ncbi:chromosome alignment defect 1 [Musca autumnalis]|uniref:chromosome alignment defect 1 n=1 Tax=Musca autumnalis TaxID=221902 RepID=UPI003CF71B5C